MLDSFPYDNSILLKSAPSNLTSIQLHLSLTISMQVMETFESENNQMWGCLPVLVFVVVVLIVLCPRINHLMGCSR